MGDDPTDITALLVRAQGGDADAFGLVVERLYSELKRMASAQRRGGPNPTLGTTALVHEGYLRIKQWSDQLPNDRQHFVRLWAKVMRQVLIDQARRRLAQKRNGVQHLVELDEELVAEIADAEQFVALDDALAALAINEPRLAEVVEYRFFVGLSEAETAAQMGVSLRTVQRLWAQARSQLTGELT